MKKIVLFINFCLIFIFTGCFGKVDVNKLTVASALGIDKSEEGYEVTVQAINATGQVNKNVTNRANVLTYSVKGVTVLEALRQLTDYAPSRVYGGHFILLAFGEEMAKEGIERIYMYLYSNPETRQKFSSVIVKGGTAKDLLKIQTPVINNPASEIHSIIESGERFFGDTHVMYSDEIITSIRKKESNLVITGIEIIGDPEKGAENKNLENTSLKTRLKTVDLAFFKKDKLVGWFNQDEAQGFTHVKGEVNSTVEVVKFEDGHITFDIIKTKNRTKFKLSDNKPSITIDYKVFGRISSIESGKHTLTSEEIKKVEQLISEVVKKKMEDSINKAKTYKTDVFEFGYKIHQKNAKYWRSIEEKYHDEIFPEMEVKINVKVETLSVTY